MHSNTSSSQGSEDTPPRVALNRKVKSSIDENTNMVSSPSAFNLFYSSDS